MTEPFSASLAPRLAALLPPVPSWTAGTVPTPAPSSIGLADLIPPLEQARSRPGPGWCPQSNVADIHACVYGDDASLPTVVLFGDETAQQWYPALAELSSTRSFRLVSLTTGRCPSASVTVWPTTTQAPDTACDAWREAAFGRLGAESPAMVIVANRPGYTLFLEGQPLSPGTESQAAAWRNGLRSTLERLTPVPTVVIGSAPLIGDVPGCLSEHPTDFRTCARQRAGVIAELNHEIDSSEAAAAGATFIDPIPWLCDTTICPPVLGEYLVYDFLSLLTAPFSASLAAELDLALPAIGQAN